MCVACQGTPCCPAADAGMLLLSLTPAVTRHRLLTCKLVLLLLQHIGEQGRLVPAVTGAGLTHKLNVPQPQVQLPLLLVAGDLAGVCQAQHGGETHGAAAPLAPTRCGVFGVWCLVFGVCGNKGQQQESWGVGGRRRADTRVCAQSDARTNGRSCCAQGMGEKAGGWLQQC